MIPNPETAEAINAEAVKLLAGHHVADEYRVDGTFRMDCTCRASVKFPCPASEYGTSQSDTVFAGHQVQVLRPLLDELALLRDMAARLPSLASEMQDRDVPLYIQAHLDQIMTEAGLDSATGRPPARD
ncbi:hypothetical protein [Arthrobacter mobilis]|uniref:Uncharacterized protein n=1 Tax=Arthrobacter mobilis TaxID=2724944 RepID=A0A7X6K5P8_9MICC|nr:hypothetical protein [Arthrobacter mobilis]NKX56005.1 hypothetical protein [Arthrobacter mobilis]